MRKAKSILIAKPEQIVEHYYENLCSALSISPEELKSKLPQSDWDDWKSWPVSHELNHKWINVIGRDKNRLDELYSDPEYIYTAVESYVNWTQRSVRRFVKMLTRIDAEQLPNSIVDVGGGVGLSTLLLREQLDEAFPGNSIRVVYHNFGNDENSTQLKFAKSVLKNSDRIEYIHGDVPPADAYLFFEFLEHLPSPISWLNELLNRTSPKIICHASSFSHPEHAGHFEFYDCSLLGDGTKIVKGRSASGQVSKFLKKREFQKISHKICWNGLPQFWSNSEVANHFNR